MHSGAASRASVPTRVPEAQGPVNNGPAFEVPIQRGKGRIEEAAAKFKNFAQAGSEHVERHPALEAEKGTGNLHRQGFNFRPTDEARIKREEQMRGHQSSVSKHPVPTQARRALGLRGGGCLMGRAAPKDKKAELKRREREFVFQPPGPAITWLKGERVGEEPSPSTGFPSGGGQRQPLVQTQTRQQQAPAPIPQRSIRVPQKPPNEKEKKRRLNERVARLDFKPPQAANVPENRNARDPAPRLGKALADTTSQAIQVSNAAPENDGKLLMIFDGRPSRNANGNASTNGARNEAQLGSPPTDAVVEQPGTLGFFQNNPGIRPLSPSVAARWPRRPPSAAPPTEMRAEQTLPISQDDSVSAMDLNTEPISPPRPPSMTDYELADRPAMAEVSETIAGGGEELSESQIQEEPGTNIHDEDTSETVHIHSEPTSQFREDTSDLEWNPAADWDDSEDTDTAPMSARIADSGSPLPTSDSSVGKRSERDHAIESLAYGMRDMKVNDIARATGEEGAAPAADMTTINDGVPDRGEEAVMENPVGGSDGNASPFAGFENPYWAAQSGYSYGCGPYYPSYYPYPESYAYAGWGQPVRLNSATEPQVDRNSIAPSGAAHEPNPAAAHREREVVYKEVYKVYKIKNAEGEMLPLKIRVDNPDPSATVRAFCTQHNLAGYCHKVWSGIQQRLQREE